MKIKFEHMMVLFFNWLKYYSKNAWTEYSDNRLFSSTVNIKI